MIHDPEQRQRYKLSRPEEIRIIEAKQSKEEQGWTQK